MQRDVLDNLPRPAPPPYAPHTTSMYCEDDGTYLVWTIEIRFQSLGGLNLPCLNNRDQIPISLAWTFKKL